MSGAIAFAAAAAAAAGGVSEIIAVAQAVSHLDLLSATSGLRYNSNGTYDQLVGAGSLPVGNWVDPAGAAADWEVRATVASGPFPDGPLSGWVPLSTTRSWSLTRTSSGVFETNLTLEFRRVGDTVAEVTIEDNLLTVEVF